MSNGPWLHACVRAYVSCSKIWMWRRRSIHRSPACHCQDDSTAPAAPQRPPGSQYVPAPSTLKLAGIGKTIERMSCIAIIPWIGEIHGMPLDQPLPAGRPFLASWPGLWISISFHPTCCNCNNCTSSEIQRSSIYLPAD